LTIYVFVFILSSVLIPVLPLYVYAVSCFLMIEEDISVMILSNNK